MNNSFIDRVNAIVQQSQQPQSMMAPAPDPVYPDTGIGALENVANNVPRQTMIRNQPHMLAYINPQEENLLQDYRNDAPVYIGPDGIPAYAWYDGIVDTYTAAKEKVTDFFSGNNNNTTNSTVTNTNTNTGNNVVTDNSTGSNTALQNLTNLITFAGNKSYVDGKEITVNNLGQNFANFVDNDDNLEYVNNILIDKNTGLEAVGTQAQEAFFNTGEGSQVAIRAADAEAAGVDLSYADGAPVYTVTSTNSGKDYTFSTLAGANEMKTNILNEANRIFALDNDIEALFLSGNNPRSYYLDDSGTRYDTPQEALAANELLASQVPVETTNSVVAQDFGQVYDASGNRIDAGALPTGSNSVRETIANLITPFDSAYYEDGTLYGYDKDGNVIDLTGGGESYNSLTGTSNYVYGVSDDADTGTAVDTTGMSEDEATVAEIKDDLLRDIPPNDLAYFASFFGNRVIPYFGGMLAGQMLDAGIEDRRAIVDEQISALETGATPLFNDAGEYIGFDTSTMTGNVSAILDEYGAEGLLPGGLPEDVADEENERFNTVFDVQSTAADADPTGMSTEDGFITTGSGYGALDGTEYYIEGDGSVQEVTDGIVSYDEANSGESVESVYGIEEAAGTTFVDEDQTPAVSKIYDRFFRSGSSAGLPAYMARWIDGIDFNERLEKVMVDGQVVYINSKGETIPAEYLESTLRIDEDGNIIETED